MTERVIQHGTTTGYARGKCRCSECRGAWAAYHRARRQQHPGQSRGLLPARYISERVVAHENGCWIWQGRLDAWGYGKDCKGLPAHRSAYLAFVGEIPAGLVLDHLCRNRQCCNPAHLEPVTPQENNRRAVEARRLRLSSA